MVKVVEQSRVHLAALAVCTLAMEVACAYLVAHVLVISMTALTAKLVELQSERAKTQFSLQSASSFEDCKELLVTAQPSSSTASFNKSVPFGSAIRADTSTIDKLSIDGVDERVN